MFPQHSSSQDGMIDACSRTATTRRRPSRTSRSCRLSSSFLICCAGNGLVGLRGPTSLAASRVRSRAWACVSDCRASSQGWKAYIPVSSRPLMREMDSIPAARECLGESRVSLDRSREAGWKMAVQKNVRLHRQGSDNIVLALLRTISLHKPQSHMYERLVRLIMEFTTHTMDSAQVLLCKPARLSA